LVKIRLKRMGAKKRPFYRLVVADSRSPRDGRFIELLGYYDPLPNPAKVQIDADKVREWIGKGARPSDAARALLVEQGILARTQRAFAVAPATAAAAATPAPVASGGGASETPGVSEEVDAVDLEPAPVATPETVAAEQDVETPAGEAEAAE
jgi:small subunit ribosomal protein S16